MFDELTKRGWITAVIRTNSARTAIMPVSLTRKTRSVSRRDPTSAGAPDGSRGGARVVLTVPSGSLLRPLRVRRSRARPAVRFCARCACAAHCACS